MIAISAVAMQRQVEPAPQAGVKCEALPVLPAVNASSPSAASAPNLAIVVRFITTAALLTPR